jgi:hypothetical protein
LLIECSEFIRQILVSIFTFAGMGWSVSTGKIYSNNYLFFVIFLHFKFIPNC